MKRTRLIKKSFAGFWIGVKAHRILSTVIAATILVGGYNVYASARIADAAIQYVVSPAMIGNIVQTVSGTGQITAANQVDLTAQASGAITSIIASVGERVSAGELIATIDSTGALNSLTNAKISLAQLVEPPKPGDVTNDQNALAKAYSDGFNSVASAFTDLQTVMPGLNSLLYGQGGFLSTAYTTTLNTTDLSYRNTAGISYDAANVEYKNVLAEYQGLSSKSATSSIRQLTDDAYGMLKSVAIALHDAQYAVSQVALNEPTYHSNMLSATQSDIASWTGTVGNDVSSVSAGRNAIDSSANSLDALLTGADPLQIQASQLSVDQAQQAYNNYFVRAPFSGTIGRIPVAVYGQAGSGTVIATLISDNKIANISLDEVDAAKVKVGQSVTITFDAISGFNATGTVSEVDLVGTVSSGVVSYNVKIAIGTPDDRIRPGMSVNVSIVTNEKDGVLMVPTSAVKAQGNQSYVQVLASSTISSYLASQGVAIGGNDRARTNRSVSLAIPSQTTPINMPVVTGLADDTNTEIVSGLAPRAWVVTRTVSGGTAVAVPSILNTLGGARAGGGGGFRGGAGAAGAVRIGG